MAAISASVFGSFWVALGLVILLADIRAFRRAGPLRRKRTRVADLEDGTAAKLVGIVRLGGETLRAPLSGRSCAGWQVATAARNLLRWRPVARNRRTAGFYLDDGTGEVFVPLDGEVELDLSVAARVHKSKRGRVPKRLRGLLASYVESDERPRAYRCEEQMITDGMRVAVYGVFRSRPDQRPESARSYRGRSYCFVTETEADVHVSDDRATLG
jgi:hypothetical protein